MIFENDKEQVLMHGPAFDGSGKIVERTVVRADVPAFRNSGYELGSIPESVQLKAAVAELKSDVAEVKAPAAKAKKKK